MASGLRNRCLRAPDPGKVCGCGSEVVRQIDLFKISYTHCGRVNASLKNRPNSAPSRVLPLNLV